ncbi:MAG: hypothetical protein ACR2M1_11550 [Gemmatimonadaceae bacterium]
MLSSTLLSISPNARPDFVPSAQLTVSPEVSGIYECPTCGERDGFVGTDTKGWGGPDFCDCGEDAGEHDTDCEVFADVELSQSFTVVEQNGTASGAHVSYDSFEGGGSGAEIGTYTSIHCARCDALVWEAGSASEGVTATE